MSSPAKEELSEDGDVEMAAPDGASSPQELTNALYARCAREPLTHIFDQDELLSFNILPENTVEQLFFHTNQLTNKGLLKVLNKDGKACWKIVKESDAAKYRALTQDEALVYSYVEASQRDGIWTKLLRSKTGLHMHPMNRAIKTLESKNYIKSIKTARWPSRKTYILAKLQPSEDVTGGPFYTDGLLDEEFIRQMLYWIERYVIGRSWWHPPMPEASKKKLNPKMSQLEIEQARAKELQSKKSMRTRSDAMLPFPVQYNGFPTLGEITKAINAAGLSALILKESELAQMLDVLCWDARLEKIKNGKTYRAVRLIAEIDSTTSHNGLTESPCGRCPVFEFCEDDGPVNARTCPYFHEWLQI